MRPPSSARPPLFSPRQKNLSKRLAAFALRFWPLWIVWLLILALPVSREVLQLHTLGSPLVRLYDQSWRQSFGRGQEFNGFRAAKAHPRDLNARLWRFSLMMRGQRADFNYRAYKPEELLREANAIRAAFPHEKWLAALPVRAIALGMAIPLNNGDKSVALRSDVQAGQWIAIIQKAARLEPNNAFYPFVEATVWRRNRKHARAWAALQRASLCPLFDAHNLEIARGVVAAHEAIRPLLLEEKHGVWQEHNLSIFKASNYWDQDGGSWIAFFQRIAHPPAKGDGHRALIETGVVMARLGDLMQRGKNTTYMARIGGYWKNAAWSLPPLTKAQRRARRRRGFAQHQSSDFAHYAARHGRGDVAALVPQWAARQRELRYLMSEDYDSDLSRLSPRDALWRAGWSRDAGAFVGMQLFYIAAFWLVANLFLWRGAGASSTSRARAFPALLWAITTAALAWWAWLQVDEIDSLPWNPRRMYREIAAGSVAIFAFIAAPFALALWCALATMWKNKDRFSHSTRLQTELRLYPIEAGLLKAGATSLCALAIAVPLALWALFLILTWNDIRTFDLGGWLPDAANGASLSFPIPTEALFAPILYCLFLDALCFLLWFIKWRWFSGKENRALTHGGLRFWKESLGFYLVFVSLIYWGTSLAAWPSRAAAHRELELRATRGELPP